MLKMKAKAMGNKQGKVLFDVDTMDENTFITGGGVPGRKKADDDDEV